MQLLHGALLPEAGKHARIGAFGQIVLIMDCCRDVLQTSPYDRLLLTDASAPSAERVSMLAIYATPRGGKAQEGELEPGGPIVGFLTHSVFRAIREMPPDVLGRVSATSLARYISLKWSNWFLGPSAPPKPRILPPYEDQAPIYFASGRTNIVDQEFSIPVVRPLGLKISIQTASPYFDLPRNEGAFTDTLVSWTDASGAQVDVQLSPADVGGRQTFSLRLLKLPHELDSNDPGRAKLVFTPGGQRVDL